MTDKQKVQKHVRIRPMGTDDISAVLDIDHKISGMQRAITYDDPADGDLGGELEFSVVAEKDDKVVDFIFGKHLYMGEPVSEVGLIQTLGVDPDYRRQGIATKLVYTLFELYFSKGIKNVQVMVSGGDGQLDGFFTQLDFHRGYQIVYTKDL